MDGVADKWRHGIVVSEKRSSVSSYYFTVDYDYIWFTLLDQYVHMPHPKSTKAYLTSSRLSSINRSANFAGVTLPIK
jgi:hypothetical protein